MAEVMEAERRYHDEFVPIRECKDKHEYVSMAVIASEKRLEIRMDKVESKMWAIIMLLIVNLTSVVTGIAMLILEKK